MKEMLKKISVGLVLLPLLGVMLANTATASKNFDPAKTDDQLVESILKGVKSEKPPAMPSYEAKGITPEQAKALAAYMRTLKQ